MVRISYPSPRVSQLDAHILDSELLSLLKQQLISVFQLQTSWWTYNHHPELWTLLLNLLVFRLTVWKSGSSYGLSLQNLKLANFKDGKLIGLKKRGLLCAILIGEYLFLKIQSYIYSQEVSEDRNSSHKSAIQKLKESFVKNRETILSRINDTFKVINLLNFTLFLVNGKYPSVVHRVLGISLTPVVTDLLKFNGNNVNFEFQNRQLVWNVMTEFLVFILPLLKLRSLRRKFNKLISGGKKQNNNNGAGESGVTPYTRLPVSQCAICMENNRVAGKPTDGSFPVTNPYTTNCGHIYCYICISSKFNSIKNSDGDNDTCLRCNEKLHWFKEFDDIDESAIVVQASASQLAEEEAESDEDEASVESKDEYVDSESDASEEEEEEDDDGYDNENKSEHVGEEPEQVEDEEESSDSYSEGEEFDEDEAFEL